MKILLFITLLLTTACSTEMLENFARDPLPIIGGLIAIVVAIALIFVIFIPTASVMDKFYKKVKWSDGFIGWLIGAIVITIGLIILQFGTEFIFGLI